jgi:Undecaprenyl-phosphate galactose phosphotransferase WbaP
MNISIIIPTLNAEKHFPTFQEAIKTQSVQPYEIIVIDSQSTDNTVRLFEEMGARVLTIQRSQFQHGKVRNMGAKESKGEILIFMTQDAIPADEYWLENLAQPIRNGKAEATFARQIPYEDANPLEQYARAANYPSESRIVSQRDIESLGGRAYFFSNSCSAIKKDIFEVLGGFTTGTIMNEDMLFAAKFLKNSYRIAYCANAVVNHSHNYRFSQTFKRYFDIGVVMKQAQYELGSLALGKTGVSYVKGLIHHLVKQKHFFLIPAALWESVVKWFGFNLGLLYQILPQSILKRLSMHGTYWNAERYPFSFLNSFLSPALLILGDILTITICMLLAYILRSEFLPGIFGIEEFVPLTNYLTLWPVIVILILLRVMFGLYPGYGLNPADELRRQTQSSAFVLFFTLAGGALFQFNLTYSRIVLVLGGILILLVLPITRAFLKWQLSKTPFYGTSVWVLGNLDQTELFRNILERSPVLGLKVVGFSTSIPEDGFAKHCLVVPDGLENTNFSQLLDQLHRKFPHVWVAPSLFNTSSVWVTPHDLNGHLTLELRNKLLEPKNEILKRALDFTVTLLSIPVLLPVMAFIALMIRLDSKGSVIYKQIRIGRFGRTFQTYKFRTMKVGTDFEFEKFLQQNPLAMQEWKTRRKLFNDPRITRVGSFLRRSSLDELPQLFNILKGDMSFVGPRPIMQDELSYYGSNSYLYTQVLPGLTGLMQVSGRSNLTYDERIKLDVYYARNWSVWLDMVILAKTVVAVFRKHGAY